MDFFNALRGQKGQLQTGSDTVDKLCDRIEHGTLLEDRRAAVQALKACTRDHRKVETAFAQGHGGKLPSSVLV